MAFSFYLNLEIIALKIVDKNIEQMTDANVFNNSHGTFCNEEKLENNLEHGMIVIIMLCNYIESLVNTILRDCIHCKREKLIKSNLEKKLNFIFSYYQKNMTKLVSCQNWTSLMHIRRIRNELMHFKFNFVGDSGIGIPDIIIDNQPMQTIFTKSNMLKNADEIKGFAEILTSSLELSLNKDIGFIECDGSTDIVSYVYDSRIR